MGKRKSLHENFGSDAPKILSGMIQDAAEKNALPERFMGKNDPNGTGATVIIVDTTTMRQVTLGLCDYPGARKALNALFGDN